MRFLANFEISIVITNRKGTILGLIICETYCENVPSPSNSASAVAARTTTPSTLLIRMTKFAQRWVALPRLTLRR